MFGDRLLKKYKTLLQKEVCDPHHAIPLPRLPAAAVRFPKTVQPTVIGEGVTVKGELRFQQELRIHGLFEGTLLSDGKVIIGPCGTVRADLQLQEIEVYGRVIGNLTVSHLILRKGCRIDGDIQVKSLLIEEGAQVNGSISVGSPLSFTEALPASG